MTATMTRVTRAAALCWLLAGCAAMAPDPGTQPATATATARTYQDTIELTGRLSVQYQQGGRDEAVHGNFTWSQTPRKTTVTLLSPLGQTMAIITVEPGRATLQQAGQPPRTANDADTLAAATFGWPLPVAGLRDWLQGFAIDAQGQRWSASATPGAQVTTQDGWRITYASWQPESPTSNLPLPRRIDLARQTVEAGTVAIRLVIDSAQPK